MREPITVRHPSWDRAGTWLGRGVVIGFLAALGAVFLGLIAGLFVGTFRLMLALLT